MNDDTTICPYCGQEVSEDLDDWCETPRGIAHDICYAEWLDDYREHSREQRELSAWASGR